MGSIDERMKRGKNWEKLHRSNNEAEISQHILSNIFFIQLFNWFCTESILASIFCCSRSLSARSLRNEIRADDVFVENFLNFDSCFLYVLTNFCDAYSRLSRTAGTAAVG